MPTPITNWKEATDTNAGNSAIYGAPDVKKISRLFNGEADVDDVKINSEFYFANGKQYLLNPAGTFTYQIVTGAIAADRTLTIPLLTGNDIMVTADFAQILTNKTMSGASNGFSNIGYSSLILTNSIVDGDVVSITTRSKIPSNLVYDDEINNFGDFLQTFKDDKLKIMSPSDVDGTTIINAEQTADRNLTIPILSGNDIIAVLATAQTFTAVKTFDNEMVNKVVTTPSDPTSGYVKVYAKQVDTNNDGYFIKEKVGGSVVEMRII